MLSKTTDKVITTINLSKLYNNLKAVDEINLSISKGEFFGLLGPNGSGKTTLISMLSSLITPSSGEIFLFGEKLQSNLNKVKSQIGLVFQELALDRNMTVYENMKFSGRLHSLSKGYIKNRLKDMLNLFEMDSFYNSSISDLSGGSKRAIDIIRGILHEPEILFLDEPTIGLDLINRKKIWHFIDKLRIERGMTVILTTHYLEEADKCDNVSFIKKGKIISEGNPMKLTEKIGEKIIEIESEDLDKVNSILSGIIPKPKVINNTAYYKFSGESKKLIEIQECIDQFVKYIRVRKPNLNDVFIWSTHEK